MDMWAGDTEVEDLRSQPKSEDARRCLYAWLAGQVTRVYLCSEKSSMSFKEAFSQKRWAFTHARHTVTFHDLRGVGSTRGSSVADSLSIVRNSKNRISHGYA